MAARSLETGFVPTKLIMQRVDEHLAPLEKQYKLDRELAEGRRFGGNRLPDIPSPLQQLADGSGVGCSMLAKRVWAYRNGRIGTTTEIHGGVCPRKKSRGKGIYRRGDPPLVSEPQKGGVSPWMEFDTADALLCEMHMSWFSSDELHAVYEAVNLVVVDAAKPCVAVA